VTMTPQALLALELDITIAGFEIFVERSLETLKCIEEAAGMSAAAFAARVERHEATIIELRKVYSALLRRVPKAPTDQQIEEWLYSRGTDDKRFAIWCYSLTIGADHLEQVLNARRTGSPPSKEGGRSPLDPTDGSTGALSLDWVTVLAGLPRNSGARLGSN
jgi:hypothetical protein